MLRTPLALFTCCLLPIAAAAAEPPVTGKAVPGFEPVERVVRRFRDRFDCTAATVAVTKNGVLLLSRGYGWMDNTRSKPVPPDALMRLGSLTKPFTAAAVKASVRAGHLKFDDKAFALVKVKPPKGKPADDRIEAITVRQLLEHKGGWAPDPDADPMFQPKEVAKVLRLAHPVGPNDLVAYELTRQLDFTPGARTAYCNFGYCALGRVLETAEKKPTYYDALRALVLKPADITDVKAGTTRRDPREVAYPVPADAMRVEALDSTAGLIASAPAVCRFLERYWIPSGDPRSAGQRGEGYAFGSIPGTTTLARQRPDGVNAVVLFNGRRDRTAHDDVEVLRAELDEALREVFR